ncbi:MAG: putative exopolyphosphatase Ppx [Herminiimonas sp.]|nr:putative exopolyphosphatase Ppx [Herminiimonas sp.]
MLAAVDLGSNSFRLHIAELAGGKIRIVKSARDPIRLGAGLDEKGNLTPQAMRSAIDCLARFSTILAEFPVTSVRVVATNTLRIARNRAMFLPQAEQAIGYPIEIISGEEEGRLIYLGVSDALPASQERRLVIDIGGGSTELILGVGSEIEKVESFTIGTVSQSLGFFPQGRIDASTFNAAVLSACSRFEDVAADYSASKWSQAYGSSGTVRAIADAISKNGIGDGTVSRHSVDALRDRLIGFGNASKVELAGMKPDRAGVIMGGLAVLIGLMQQLGIQSITPIEAGLRMGVLTDLTLRSTRRDRRELAVREFLQRFHVDETRANRVGDMARTLFLQLKPSSDNLLRHLYWSALLHEVGMSVSHSGYHKHGAYLVENADLSGFTTREQRMMGTLVLGQKGNLRKVSDALANADLNRAILAMRLAVLFMHSRLDAKLEGVRVKMKTRIDVEIQREWVVDHPTLSYWLDKEREHWREIGVEFSSRLSGES